jgi:hypothetical protein
MSATAAVRAELIVSIRDQASAGLKSVAAAAEQTAQKTAGVAAASASKSAAAVEASTTRSRTAYERMATARETLGIRSERAIQREIQQTEAAYNRLARSGTASAMELARAQEASLRRVRELKTEMGEVEKAPWRPGPGAVAAVTGAYMLAKPAVTRAVAYDHSVAAITNTLYSDRDKDGRVAGKAEVKAAIAAALKQGGGDRDQAAATLAELVSSGEFSQNSAFKMLGTIQQASTASLSDSKDLAAIALSLKRAGVKEDRLPAMLSKTIRAGQLGGFELSDMAKSLPEAMALAKKLGVTGEQGFERLLVSMQSSVLTAGTKSAAANNLANLLGKVDSQDTANDFKKLGINLTDELAKGAGRGESTIDTFVSLIDRVVQKDPKMKALAKESDRLAALAGDKKNPQREDALNRMQQIYASGAIGKVLQDRQALMGFLAEKEGRAGADPLASRVREGVKADNGQELERSFAVMNDTASVQMQRMANANAEGQDRALTAAGSPFKPLFQSVTAAAEEFPLLTASVTAATAALGLLAGAAGLNAMLGSKGPSGVVGKAVAWASAGLVGSKAAGLMAKVPVVPKGPGMFGLAANLGGATLSSIAGEESGLARYGSAALTGAGIGATVGSIVPFLGTGAGAVAGGALGLLLQWAGEGGKPKSVMEGSGGQETKVKADITVALAPGLVLQGQNFAASGGATVHLNTGNVFVGAP